MEENKVVISVDDLRFELREVVDKFRDDLDAVLDVAEEYIGVAHVLNEEEEDNHKFKVGDVITGKNNKDYGITNNESVLLVTDIIDREHIKVKVISHKEMPAEVGQYYQVMEKHFKLITDIL